MIMQSAPPSPTTITIEANTIHRCRRMRFQMPSIDSRSSSRREGTAVLTGGVWYGPRFMPLLLPFGGVIECVTVMRPQLVSDPRRHHARRGGERRTGDVNAIAREPAALGHVKLVARSDRRPTDGRVLREVDVDLLTATTQFKM